MDNILLLTVVIIFFTSLLSRIVQKNDRVLKSIKGFHITVIQNDGKKMWGKAHMYINGMKLLFSRPHQSSGGSWVDSYLFYQSDMQYLRLIFRYQDELSPLNRQRRKIEITRVSNPASWRKALRQMRNFISNFQEAFSETLGVLLNRFKSSNTDIIKASEKHLKLAGSTAIGAAGKEYDQILENHINQKVVVALKTEKHSQEFTGFLGEYSAQWLALMDCKMKQDWYLPLNDINKLILNRNIDVSFMLEGSQGDYQLVITISNHSQQDIELKRLEGQNFTQKIHRTIAAEKSESITLKNLPDHLFPQHSEEIVGQSIDNIAPERGGQFDVDLWKKSTDQLPDCELVYSASRYVDVYVPRSAATVRHSVCQL